MSLNRLESEFDKARKDFFMKKEKEFFRKDSKVKILTGVIACLIMAVVIHFAEGEKVQNAEKGIQYYSGKVLEVLGDTTVVDEDTEGIRRGSQVIKVEVTSGPYKGETAVIDNYISALYNIYAKPGTHIILRTIIDEENTYMVYSYDRTLPLYSFVFLFAVLLCIIGGKKGFSSLVGLAIMLVGILKILLPLLIKGYPAMITTMLLITFAAMIGFILIDGINKKTISSFLGTMAGVISAGILAYLFGKIAHIGGFQLEEAETLLLISRENGLKVGNLLTCGILIATLGAVMDVAMSIASAIHELHEVNNRLTAKELFQSGMNIGKDAMGTMSNTLILAFTGASLSLLLAFYSYGIPYTQLINTDLIAIEILQGIAGSIGIVLTVPLVALISSQIER